MSLSKRRPSRALALLCALCLAVLPLAACKKKPETPPPPTPEYFEPTKLPALELTEDTTDYRTLALATFENVAAAPATDLTYEATDGGIKLIAYQGNATTLILPDAIEGKPVVALGDELLKDRAELIALSIPDSVTVFGKNLLTGCRSLRVLRTPTISYLAYFFGADTPNGMGFRLPTTLDTVILTQQKVLDDRAFLECDKLTMVLLPEGLQSIGDFAFMGCTKLHYLPLPETLTDIGEYAFANCRALVRFSLPNRLQKIGLGALMGCTKLQQLSLPFLGQTATDAATAHLGYLFGASSYTWNDGHVPASLLKVTLRSGNVPDYAFYDCTTLALVELPSDAQTIGIRAFYGCSALQRIAFPSSLRTVGEMAFAQCTLLSEIDFNEGLTTLGLQAFYDCYNLTEITLPDSLRALPASVFADCRCLRRVTLGMELATIGAMAFRNCSSLTTVQGGSTVLDIQNGNDYFTAVRK